ncbi:MAG: glycosyl transferase, partial [Sulfitobacter sp.]|nr:glycosyl transferase [Sulfitobacter sp.]
MAKIAYILLCHKDPQAIIRQAERLTVVGDYMAIHFDASASKEHYTEIRSALADNPNVTFAQKRVRCGWGEWSLVQATLNAVTSAVEAFPRATHFYMLSGDCMAIKSAEYTHQYLDENDADFIESFDYFESDWIKTGWREERLIYRHYVNERERKKLFYFLFEAQKRLGLQRAIPADLQIMIGSQWWCLRRQTIEAVLEFARKRRDVVRFFRTTWIPDETFFQTLVRHLVPGKEIQSRTLTFLMFTDYGMPVTFYNDHYELLLSQDYLFARKISPEAQDLKRRLGLLYAAEGVPFQISNEGRSLFEFLSGRGRIGRRFATRFWETESTLGR